MAAKSRQGTINEQVEIGTNPPIFQSSGTFKTEIDNIYYDTRCRLYNGHRPMRMVTLSVNTTDDMGDTVTQSYDTPDTDENGTPIKEKFIQCDDSHDEKYFYHVWDWKIEDLNDSLQKTVQRTIRGIKINTFANQSFDEDTPTTTTTTGTLVTGSANWTMTLDKVDISVSGLPPSDILNLYYGATDDSKIFFQYTSDTDYVLKVGDIINGATVTKVWNPLVHDMEDDQNVVKSTTLCYAEISGGENFVADEFYNISSESSSIISTVASGIVTHHFNDDRNYTISLDVSDQIVVSGNITVRAQAENDPGSRDSSNNSKHYLITFKNGVKLTSADQVTVSVLRNVTAFGIQLSSDPIISRRELVSSNSVKIWFKRTEGNLDNTYLRKWSVSVNQSLTGSNGSNGHIKVISGKGIKYRAAAVGSYIERPAKQIKVKPVFYKNELTTYCIQETLTDNNAIYFLGTVSLNDGTNLFEDEWIIKSPKTNKVKVIYNVCQSNFSYSPTKEQVETWLRRKTLSNLDLRNRIISDLKKLFGTRKVSIILDNCKNNINAATSTNFDPFDQIRVASTGANNLRGFDDYCNTSSISNSSIQQSERISADQVAQNIKDIISGTISNPTLILPDDMYKNIISNENSLLNSVFNAMTNIEGMYEDMTTYTVSNDIHTVDGDNESKVDLTKNSWRDIPQKFPKIDMFADDIIVDDTRIDIVNVDNIRGFTIKCIPRFFGPSTLNDPNYDIAINKTSGGYMQSVVATSKTITVTPIIGLAPVSEPSVTYGPGGTGLDQGRRPHTIWSVDDLSTQISYLKQCRFRTEELSEHVKIYSGNRGTPYITNPTYARLTSDIRPSDTTINVNSTNGFLSSGYLIIPKFLKKLEYYGTSKNIKTHYFYDGEEIIYYSGKTPTSFTGCKRQRFGTKNSFVTSTDRYRNSPEVGAVTSGYTAGESISQYHPYRVE
jgi:hypothetical protein